MWLRIRARSGAPWLPWYNGGCHGSSCFIDRHVCCAWFVRVKYTFPPNKIVYCSRAKNPTPSKLKKNPPQNSVEVGPAKSQKESTPKFCLNSVEAVPTKLKKNPPLNSVEAVPAKSQIKSPPKFCGGMYVVPPAILQIMEDPQISKRIHP